MKWRSSASQSYISPSLCLQFLPVMDFVHCIKGLTTITFGFRCRGQGERQGKVCKFILKILCRGCTSFLFIFYLTEVGYMITLGFKVFWLSVASKTLVLFSITKIKIENSYLKTTKLICLKKKIALNKIFFHSPTYNILIRSISLTLVYRELNK